MNECEKCGNITFYRINDILACAECDTVRKEDEDRKHKDDVKRFQRENENYNGILRFLKGGESK